MSDEKGKITKIKIGNMTHVYSMGVCSGMAEIVKTLEEMQGRFAAVPGFQLALATARAEAESMRALLVSKNLAALAKEGVDISRHRAVTYDPNTGEMICEEYPPDLFE